MNERLDTINPILPTAKVIGLALCKWLEIDPHHVTAITLAVRVGKIPTVTIERLCLDAEVGDVPTLENLEISLKHKEPKEDADRAVL